MAQTPSTRVYTCDMAILGIGGKTGFITAGYLDFLGIMRNVKLSVTKEFVDPVVPQDVVTTGVLGFRKRRRKRFRWTADLSAVTDVSTPQTLLLYLALVKVSGAERDRGLMSLRFYRPGGTAKGASAYYTGQAYITEAHFSVGGEGPIMQSGTLTGYGPLTRVGG